MSLNDNYFVFIGAVVKFEREVECGPMFILTNKINCSFKLRNDHFADHEAKSDSIHVYLSFFVLYRTKKLEKVWLVNWFDSDSVVDYRETNLLGVD